MLLCGVYTSNVLFYASVKIKVYALCSVTQVLIIIMYYSGDIPDVITDRYV
jgi:hypothetical protein